MGSCLFCPTNSNSPSGSSARASCICNRGFTGPDGGPCTVCVAGKYKTTTGSVVCTDCGAGTYSTTLGATAAATCLACPANSNSPAGSTTSTSCTCNVGFALSGDICVCALGYQPGV
jgi:syndecan 4